MTVSEKRVESARLKIWKVKKEKKMKRRNQRRLRVASAFGLVVLGLIPLGFGGAEQNATPVFAQDASIDEMLQRGLNAEETEKPQEVEIEAQAQNNFESSENAKKGRMLIQEWQNALQQGDFRTALEKTNALLQMDDVKNNPQIVQAIEFHKLILNRIVQFFPQGFDGWRSAKKAGERRVLNVNGVEFPFRWCPPGSFAMGSAPMEKVWNGQDEPLMMSTGEIARCEKQHSVRLTKGFWILETEVTQKMWTALGRANPSVVKVDANPVDRVSWFDCQEALAQLNDATGSPQGGFIFRLPTEAEWEYACRAGTTGSFNDDSTNGVNVAQAASDWVNGLPAPTPVAQKRPNRWGLYDMHGNVSEWCWDWYDENAYYMNGANLDPLGPAQTQCRVIRGGSYRTPYDMARSAARGYGGARNPGARELGCGFRFIFVEVSSPMELAQWSERIKTALQQRQIFEKLAAEQAVEYQETVRRLNQVTQNWIDQIESGHTVPTYPTPIPMYPTPVPMYPIPEPPMY